MKAGRSGIIEIRFVLCNEVVRHLPFYEQARLSAALGYDGLEVALFTPHPDVPHHLSKAQRSEFRRKADDVGQPITGLHWLLHTTSGLSITEAAVYDENCDVMRALIDLAHDLGATYLVHGSPAQRKVSVLGNL
jgi:D-psicose/D-tagatose/L-ribulose 3-epimerase